MRSQPFSPTELQQKLLKLPLFQGATLRSLAKLVDGARWRQVSAGEVVVLEGEAQSGLYFLQYGWMKVVKISPTGREQILRFLEPGETFNEIGVFANLPNPATAIALEDAGIWLIRRDALQKLLLDHPEFAQFVISKMAERMLYLVSLVSDLSLKSVTSRLARLILHTAVDDVLHRPRWYTQAELAARLGTVSDVVQRALRELVDAGIIEVERQKIVIINQPALVEKAAE